MWEAPLLASLFHTIAAVISGFTTAFWFMVFIGAMALLIFMPAPSPKPKAEEAPAKPPEKNSEEAKWRQMLYATDAKWRRMMVMMHLQNAKQAAQPQPPVHVNIIASPDMLRQMNAGAGGGLLENSVTSNDSSDAAQNNPALNQDGAALPNAARKRFRLPRAPKLALPRPRRAAKTTADEI